MAESDAIFNIVDSGNDFTVTKFSAVIESYVNVNSAEFCFPRYEHSVPHASNPLECLELT